MLISYQWLKDFVDFDLDPTALAERLTEGGIEVEGIETRDLEGDVVFDVAIPPNRADLMSHYGLAREIAALTQTSPPRWSPLKRSFRRSKLKSFRIKIEAKSCPRYTGAYIRGIQAGTSPPWLAERLEKCGIRSIHPVVDVTNYVLLEMGQPLHAFDASKLKGGTIQVRPAEEGEPFRALDGKEYLLDSEALVIADTDRAVALAGIIGGAETEVELLTREIFLESAYFLPISIRKTSRRYSVRTESSQRFERGVDPEGVLFGLYRAIDLILEITDGHLEGTLDRYPDRISTPKILFRPQKLHSLLGEEYPTEEMVQCFRSFGCEIKERRGKLRVIPPSYRPDLEQEADLIEEFARWRGLETIPAVLPPLILPSQKDDPSYGDALRLKEWMRFHGCTEIVSLPFVGEKALHGIDGGKGEKVWLQNPLSEEESQMSPLLAPNLVRAVKYHWDRQIQTVRLFEVGKTFSRTGERIRERLRLGSAWTGLSDGDQWCSEKRPVDFFDIKGFVQALLEELYRFHPSFEPRKSQSFLHPSNQLTVLRGKTEIGFLGQLHLAVQRSFEMPQPIYLFEIDIEKIGPIPPISNTYQPVPKYPGAVRDLSFVISDSIPYGEIQNVCSQFKKHILKDFWLFDLYTGSKISKGTKSMALRFFFQHDERTLTEEEVEKEYRSIQKELTEKLQIEVRH